MMTDPNEQAERLAAVKNAIGTTRLAGLEIDEETKADLYRVSRGEITIEAVKERLWQRIKAGEFKDR